MSDADSKTLIHGNGNGPASAASRAGWLQESNYFVASWLAPDLEPPPPGCTKCCSIRIAPSPFQSNPKLLQSALFCLVPSFPLPLPRQGTDLISSHHNWYAMCINRRQTLEKNVLNKIETVRRSFVEDFIEFLLFGSFPEKVKHVSPSKKSDIRERETGWSIRPPSNSDSVRCRGQLFRSIRGNQSSGRVRILYLQSIYTRVRCEWYLATSKVTSFHPWLDGFPSLF